MNLECGVVDCDGGLPALKVAEIVTTPVDRNAANPFEVAHNFDKKAHVYHEKSNLQKQIAQYLFDWLDNGSFVNGAPTSILELGCGTGHLTQILAKSFPKSAIFATDISPNMLEQCKKNTATFGYIDYQILNIENPCDWLRMPPVEWVISSMCMQWVAPIEQALKLAMTRGSRVAFSLQLDGSFSAWISAHQLHKKVPNLHPCPSFEAVQRICQNLAGGEWELKSLQKTIWEKFQNGCDFAYYLRNIGADTPRQNHVHQQLQRVFRELSHGCAINHEIGFFCLLKKSNPPRVLDLN